MRTLPHHSAWLVVTLVTAVNARAQQFPRWEAFAGFSYGRSFTLERVVSRALGKGYNPPMRSRRGASHK
jgi:hypothetical protein